MGCAAPARHRSVLPDQRRRLGAAGERCGGDETPPDPCPLSRSVARCGGRRSVSDLRVRRERSIEGSCAPEIVAFKVRAALLSENTFPAVEVLLGLLVKASAAPANCQPEGLARRGQAWGACSNHSRAVVLAESFVLAHLR